MNKNNIFFLALTFFSFNFATAWETNRPETYTFEYTFTPRNFDDRNDFNQAVQNFVDLCNSTHRNQESNLNFYDNLLNFIKELQASVVAGVNLLSSSTLTNENVAEINNLAQTAQEVVDVAGKISESQTATETSNSDTTTQPVAANTTPDVQTPKIQFVLTITSDQNDKTEVFEALKNKLTVLSHMINNQTSSPEEIIALFNAVIEGSKELNAAGSININVVS